MMFSIYVEPHERYDAVEAFNTRLSADQIREIFDAPDGARIHLQFGLDETSVTILEEGKS